MLRPNWWGAGMGWLTRWLSRLVPRLSTWVQTPRTDMAEGENRLSKLSSTLLMYATHAPCTHKNNNNDNNHFLKTHSSEAITAAGEGLGSPWYTRVDRHGSLWAGDPDRGWEQLCVNSTKTFGDLWFEDFPQTWCKLLRFLPFKFLWVWSQISGAWFSHCSLGLCDFSRESCVWISGFYWVGL